METPLGKALLQVNTSRSWSLLPTIVPKLQRQLRSTSVDVNELIAFLTTMDEKVLNLHGIWIEGLSSSPKVTDMTNGHDVLICINAPYGRARQKDYGKTNECTCKHHHDRKIDFASQA